MAIGRAVEAVLASDDVAVTAKLHWRTVTRPVDYDVNDEGDGTGVVVVPGVLEFRALFHRVAHRLSGFQRFVEVEAGDVMIDYAADLALAGKEDVRIEVGGEFFTQKNASTGLLEAWDAMAGHGGTMKTLLLTPVP